MPNLFSPFDLSGTRLGNRIVMAPMTRARATTCVADEKTALYYTQRASAGLIISEGTPVSEQAMGYLFIPGIYTPAHITGWQRVTKSIHAQGSKMFAQLWHVGRVSHTSIKSDGAAPVGASDIQAIGAKAFGYGPDGTPDLIDASKPRALETDEVDRVIEDFAQGSENAIAAGFDGVEIHGANGYLLDQFINPLVNTRTDKYAAQTLNGRLRFVLDLVDAVVDRVGRNRVGIRLSPYGQPFAMPLFDGIPETFQTLVAALADRGIAYVHFMDHSRAGSSTNGRPLDPEKMQRFDALMSSFRAHSGDMAIILASAMTKDRATQLIRENVIDLPAFGRPFIANPDLVSRLAAGHPLAEPNPDTFYGGGNEGYLTYPPYDGA
ncbi:alkene reductase [Rhodobacteraceae bacterium D3-12]|nr:alkene reductase [Rhodobacteraceae bacterium D3-12]